MGCGSGEDAEMVATLFLSPASVIVVDQSWGTIRQGRNGDHTRSVSGAAIARRWMKCTTSEVVTFRDGGSDLKTGGTKAFSSGGSSPRRSF